MNINEGDIACFSSSVAAVLAFHHRLSRQENQELREVFSALDVMRPFSFEPS
jgi:hypothetical protein